MIFDCLFFVIVHNNICIKFMRKSTYNLYRMKSKISYMNISYICIKMINYICIFINLLLNVVIYHKSNIQHVKKSISIFFL